MFDISSIISTQAIPVFLIPLNGLLCTVFYNRYSNINTRIHSVHTKIKELINSNEIKKNKECKKHCKALHSEMKILNKRASLILKSLYCLLISVISFCVCAIFITLTIKHTAFFEVALTLWFLGPTLIIVALLLALMELIFARKTMDLRNTFIDHLYTDHPGL